jgi:ribosome maturation factor RimP
VDVLKKIEDALNPAFSEMGYDIVRVQLSGNIRKTLQIMIERQDGEAIHVDDCAKASRKASIILDVEDFIKGAYVLEMSSPGLNRPLVKVHDFKRFVGHRVVIRTQCLIGNRKNFQGTLESATETGISVVLEGSSKEEPITETIAYEQIHWARLDIQL